MDIRTPCASCEQLFFREEDDVYRPRGHKHLCPPCKRNFKELEVLRRERKGLEKLLVAADSQLLEARPVEYQIYSMSEEQLEDLLEKVTERLTEVKKSDILP